MTSAGPGLVLQARRLRAARGVVVARDVSLTASPGDVVAVEGPNGSGKTTLLAAAAGLLPAGSASARPGSVGYAPERAGVLPRIALQQWLAGLARTSGLSRNESARRTGDLLGRLGLAHTSAVPLQAVPVPGDDLLTAFLDRVPPVARALPGHGPPGSPLATLPGKRPRYEPQNLGFAEGLNRWDLDSGSRSDAEPSQDYSAAVDGQGAALSSAVARPAGSAALVQAMFADDYRGATVVFRGDVRTERLTEQAGLRLEILRYRCGVGHVREDHAVTVSGGRGEWTRYEITAPIPEDADMIRFGIGLSGPGRVWLRNPELSRAAPDGAGPDDPEPVSGG